MTRRRQAALTLAVAWAMAVAGCSAQPVADRTSPEPGGTATSPTQAATPGMARAANSPASSPVGSGTKSPTTGVTPTGQATVANDDFRLEIRAPGCARIGGTLPVTIGTEPEADVGLIIAFSDGEAHEAYQFGTADHAGAFSTQIPIPAGAPKGTAQLLVTVGRELEGNSGQKPFTVVGAAEQCP